MWWYSEYKDRNVKQEDGVVHSCSVKSNILHCVSCQHYFCTCIGKITIGKFIYNSMKDTIEMYISVGCNICESKLCFQIVDISWYMDKRK